MSLKKQIKYGNNDFGKACQTIDCDYNKPKKRRSWVGRIAGTIMFVAGVHFVYGGFSGEPMGPLSVYVILGLVGFLMGWRYDKNDEYVFGPNQGQKRKR